MLPDIRSIARALGGEVSGRDTVKAPGPGHSPRDRSLTVKLDADAPEGFVTHSHSGDDWKTCRDYVRQRLGLPVWQPGDGQRRTVPQQHTKKWDLAVTESETSMQRTEDDLIRIERATKIWNEAGNPKNTAAERYLTSRCLELPKDLAGPVLRFHPKTPWRDESTGQSIRIPCLLAAFRSIDDDQITAIHRIRVDKPERWPKTERRMLGAVRRSAVKLGAPAKTLIIGEGVETSMAARQFEIGNFAWALGSVGAISFFPVLRGIRNLIILAEAGQASAEAIKICSKRRRETFRHVSIAKPDEGYSDLNDAGGLDFGWDHPFAAVELVWDRESDIVYVARTHRLKEASPIVHAAALRAWGDRLPWAWPRDGNRETLEGAGIALVAQYRTQGLNMLHDFAHYLEGDGKKSVSVEAGLMDMLTRMQAGKFKVFKHLNDWWEEFRLYHRKDGKVVKEGDDLMAATRYAVMMLRYASTARAHRKPLKYPKRGWL